MNTQSPEYRTAYALWRWDMWISGYGSYRDIDQAVTDGKLIPLVRPEKQAAALAASKRSWIGRLWCWMMGRE